MTLPAGSRLGPFEIQALLGKGGMGEVYRARDTRLGRTVAVKVLPENLAADPSVRARFRREARAISALSHPHICALYDLGEQDGLAYLVMEHLEGETLERSLRRGALPLERTLEIATEVLEGLAAAHRRGIVHRDLKPGNVMLTRSGVKLLDFGLAAITRAGSDEVETATAATTETALTTDGTLLGTLHYMAPEQLENRTTDSRADIFSFGAVLFEMVTGEKAFSGSSSAAVIAAILHASPPRLAQLAPEAPAGLERLIGACLSKSPDDRWSTGQDVLLVLEWITGISGGAAKPTRSREMTARERLAWSAAAGATLIAAALVLAVVAGQLGREVPTDEAVEVASILPPEQTTLAPGEAPQISPDGRWVAFVATDGAGKRGLYVRSLDRTGSRLLEGSDGAMLPFWAPHGRRLGFFASGQVKIVGVDGGAPQELAPAPVPRGGTWSRDDLILFVGLPSLPPFLVPAGGGEAVPVPMAEGDRRWFPSFLADGRHYLYLGGPRGRVGIRAASLDSADSIELVGATTSAAYGSGHLLYRRAATLMTHPFDPETRQLSGSAAPVAENVGFNPVTHQGLFSVSSGGVLVYQAATPGAQLVWFDRAGQRRGVAAPAGDYNTLCLTADQKRVIYDLADPVSGSIDLWALDLEGGSPTRLTFDPAVDFYPVCSPVSDEVVFASLREGPPNLFRLAAETPGRDSAVTPQTGVPKLPTDWSRDGALLVYSALYRATSFDIETQRRKSLEEVAVWDPRPED
jgi:hypothetical protein